MSVNEVVSNIKARFNYIVCLDLIVFVCIFVIAGRPDGLAITVSALIVGVAALIYRCVTSVKSYVANSAAKTKAAQRKTAPQFGKRVPPKAVTIATAPAKPGSKSWLRDSD
jgi:predicted Na+-dependent transporter